MENNIHPLRRLGRYFISLLVVIKTKLGLIENELAIRATNNGIKGLFWRTGLRMVSLLNRRGRILFAAMLRWAGIARDVYRKQRFIRVGWLRALISCFIVLWLMVSWVAAKLARLMGLHRWRHLTYALSETKGLKWMLHVTSVNPWFYLQSFGDGQASSAQPRDRSGYGVQIFPLSDTICFEFVSPLTKPSAIKLPIWSSCESSAEISVLAKLGKGYRLIARSEQAIPRESPDSSLRIDIHASGPLFASEPSLLTKMAIKLGLYSPDSTADAPGQSAETARAGASGRKFRVYIKPTLHREAGFINLISAEHPIDRTLETISYGSLPKISIITLLYRKELELPSFVEAMQGQDYPGEMEIIAVDDCSPDRSAMVFGTATGNRSAGGPPVGDRISWRLLANEENRGNCWSRNRGLSEATGDIAFVMDCDCIPNRHFVSEHVFSHLHGGADVVIGPYNLETLNAPVNKVIARLESDINARFSEASLQDRINTASFLNCITRNLSVRRSWVEKFQFDNDFGYSRDPDSGFGWEDVDFGVRLYAAGARMSFNPHAFTVHITHPPNAEPATLAFRSEKNFARLLRKHPDLSLIARRWAVDTHESIRNWVRKSQAAETEDGKFLDASLTASNAPSIRIKADRPLRILTYRWHPAHQYEIYKTGHRFELARSRPLGLTTFTEQWEYMHRPLPANAAFIDLEKVDYRDYDLALLHFDENVLDYQNTNGVIGENWGASFRYFIEHVPIPKVAICHGTVQFRGMYNFAYDKPDILQEISGTRERLVEYLGDTLVICNSHQARNEWGFNNSRVIWQGFDPTEFPESLRTKGILTLGHNMKERPHYRGFFFYEEAMKGFPEEFAPRGLKVEEPVFPHCKMGNEYAQVKFRNYVDAIREYSIYFNPTLRSPMPRSRGEAMMCGLVTVSANNHDVEMFINHGENGFFTSEPAEAREYLSFLMTHPENCERMGKASRKTATDVFNHDRFLGDWLGIFRELAA